jgi:hypothetical protein
MAAQYLMFLKNGQAAELAVGRGIKSCKSESKLRGIPAVQAQVLLDPSELFNSPSWTRSESRW